MSIEILQSDLILNKSMDFSHVVCTIENIYKTETYIKEIINLKFLFSWLFKFLIILNENSYLQHNIIRQYIFFKS